jgi:predicted patatin/cPLA2 family phospholipase
LEYINILEKENKIFVIRPSTEVKVDRLETNPEKIKALYQQGRSDIESIYDNLIAFLNS